MASTTYMGFHCFEFKNSLSDAYEIHAVFLDTSRQSRPKCDNSTSLKCDTFVAATTARKNGHLSTTTTNSMFRSSFDAEVAMMQIAIWHPCNWYLTETMASALIVHNHIRNGRLQQITYIPYVIVYICEWCIHIYLGRANLLLFHFGSMRVCVCVCDKRILYLIGVS